MSAENIQDSTSLLESIKSKLSSTLNVILVRDVLDYSYSVLTRIKSTKMRIQEKPDYSFKNPYSKDIMISSISLIFNSAFRDKGNLRIELDKVVIFENLKTGDFKQSQNMVLPFRKERKFKRDSELFFFIWNGTDDTELVASIMVAVGD